MAELSDQAQTRLAMAGLAAVFSKALEKQGAMVPEDFDNCLRQVYDELREAQSPSIGAMEVLTWTREFRKNLK